MSTQPTGASIPTAMPPDCPYCSEALPNLGLYAYEVGGWAILNLFCTACKRALHFQIFQKQTQEGEAPRVQIPS
jgi:hypothetical protein